MEQGKGNQQIFKTEQGDTTSMYGWGDGVTLIIDKSSSRNGNAIFMTKEEALDLAHYLIKNAIEAELT